MRVCHNELRSYGQNMLCVSQDEVARIITMHSSGTTGPPKRLYFTGDDLERTIDFFHHGMKTLVKPGQKVLILLPVTVIAGCLGVIAGLLTRRSIPAFLVGLVGTFVGWILGSGFGLAAGFGGWYEAISRLTPFTHATELLFSQYYGASIGRPVASVLFLVLTAAVMLALTGLTYRWRVMRQE